MTRGDATTQSGPGRISTLLAVLGSVLLAALMIVWARPSHPAAAAAATTVRVVDVTFTSSWDGSLQRGSLALPDPLPTAPVPLVLYLHGMFSCYSQQAPHHDVAADANIGQLVAQRGWLFAAPELHGENPVPLPGDPWDPAAGCPQPVSPGYRPMGARPAQRDVLDLLAYVRARYPVDAERVYLISFSAGGLTLLTALGKFTDRFAGAVVYSSPTDLARWLAEDPRAYPNIWLEVGGFPTDRPFAYARRSPLSFAANLSRVPLLLVHGRQDTRVPVHHARDLYTAIKAADPDAPVVLREYDGDHGGPFDPTDPAFVTLSQALDWLAPLRRPSAPSRLNVRTDADTQEQGPYRFWWATWRPAPGPERWTTVALTRTTDTVTGVLSDTVGLTLTLDLDALGWPPAPVNVRLEPPPPAPPTVQTLTPVAQAITVTVPAGRVAFRATLVLAPTPTPTPTTGTIEGTVFEDANANGLWDAGESPIAGSVITLLRDGQTLATQVTGPDGRYRFADLTPGTYLVQEDHPPCYRDTTLDAFMTALAAGQTVVHNFGHRRLWCGWLPTLNRQGARP